MIAKTRIVRTKDTMIANPEIATTRITTNVPMETTTNAETRTTMTARTTSAITITRTTMNARIKTAT